MAPRLSRATAAPNSGCESGREPRQPGSGSLYTLNADGMLLGVGGRLGDTVRDTLNLVTR